MDEYDETDDALDCGGNIAQSLYHLYYLLNCFGPEALRQVFLLHWLEKEGAPWLDTAENAAQYWEREQNVYMKERSFPKIRNLLKEGISTEWDLTALC